MNRAASRYSTGMSSSEYTDTYVIHYTQPGDLWVAFSTKTRQVGIGSYPKEALANGINAADQVVKSAAQRSGPYVSSASYELMLTLAKIAHPMTEGTYTPGVVYKYERTESPIT